MKWENQKCTGKYPPCLMGHSMNLYKTKEKSYLLLFGGMTNETVPSGSLYVLNLHTLKWKCVILDGSAPTARACHGAAMLNNRLYIFGGYGKARGREEGGDVFLNDLYELDLDKRVWRQIESEGSPAARHSHTLTAVGNRLVVYGGQGESGKLGDAHVLVVKEKEANWRCLEAVGEVPHARCSHSAIALPFTCRILVFFGMIDHKGNKKKENCVNDLYELDIGNFQKSQKMKINFFLCIKKLLIKNNFLQRQRGGRSGMHQTSTLHALLQEQNSVQR